LAKNQRWSIPDLVGVDVLPSQYAGIAGVRNIEMDLPAAGIQSDSPWTIKLHALHQVDAIVTKIRLA